MILLYICMYPQNVAHPRSNTYSQWQKKRTSYICWITALMIGFSCNVLLWWVVLFQFFRLCFSLLLLWKYKWICHAILLHTDVLMLQIHFPFLYFSATARFPLSYYHLLDHIFRLKTCFWLPFMIPNVHKIFTGAAVLKAHYHDLKLHYGWLITVEKQFLCRNSAANCASYSKLMKLLWLFIFVSGTPWRCRNNSCRSQSCCNAVV